MSWQTRACGSLDFAQPESWEWFLFYYYYFLSMVLFWKGCEQIKAMWQRPYILKGKDFFSSLQKIDSLF